MALNTGHEGGCGTVRANSASDVPARLEAQRAQGESKARTSRCEGSSWPKGVGRPVSKPLNPMRHAAGDEALLGGHRVGIAGRSVRRVGGTWEHTSAADLKAEAASQRACLDPG